MATITPTKTDSTTVLAHQLSTHPNTVAGSAIDCLTKRSATIFMYHGYVEDGADTDPGKFLVQIRPDAGDGSVNEHWITVAEYVTKGTDADHTTLTATEAAGVTEIAVTADTNFAAGDVVYLEDAGTLADSEWAYVSHTGTNLIHLVDGLTTGKDSSDKISNDGSVFVCHLDLNAVESFRVVWHHRGTTSMNGHIKALAITHDSDTSV